jgi:hypothetical protein
MTATPMTLARAKSVRINLLKEERVMISLKEWVEDRQENGDDGTQYEGEEENE